MTRPAGPAAWRSVSDVLSAFRAELAEAAKVGERTIFQLVEPSEAPVPAAHAGVAVSIPSTRVVASSGRGRFDEGMAVVDTVRVILSHQLGADPEGGQSAALYAEDRVVRRLTRVEFEPGGFPHGPPRWTGTERGYHEATKGWWRSIATFECSRLQRTGGEGTV